MVRTSNFPNSKVFITSTPTVAGFSEIEKAFEDTDKNYYYVPCPHCGTYQRLIFQNLKFEKERPELAMYMCEHCGEMISEDYKTEMLENGEWRPTDEGKVSRHRIGFHINALYSPEGWTSWGKLAAEFIQAKNDPIPLKVFINTKLGEVWRQRGEAPAFERLYNRRENYKKNEVPDDVLFLTCGCDVQKDRLELEIVGWTKDKRSYSIDYRVLVGDTSMNGVWTQLSEVVSERFQRKNGQELTIKLSAIDSGYQTTKVYEFCKRFAGFRVIPIKGVENLREFCSVPKQTDIALAGKRIGSTRVYPVGSSFAKEDIYTCLRLEKDENGVPPPGYCHFPEYPEYYFRGITAEDFVNELNKRGYLVTKWIKNYERNEPLDCRVYARAAAYLCGLDRPKIVKAMESEVETPKQERKVPIKKQERASGIWERRGERSSIWA
jgi:phage terminase large subunit GpA-like protein